jgi:Mce-associated membrane protein
MTDQTRDTETAEAVQVDDPEATEKLEKPDSPARTKRPRRDRSGMLRKPKLVPVILIVLLLISGGSAAWLYFNQYKPGQQTNPDVARTVVSAASDGTVALLSYSPESLDKDFAAAKSHLTGDFLSYYNQFTEQIVAPAAKQKSLKTTAHVMGAAVQELHPDSAVVLVFVDQSTTSKDRPDPSMAASNVLVRLTRVNGQWLITKFDPI